MAWLNHFSTFGKKNYYINHLVVLSIFACAGTGAAHAVSLKQAIKNALITNPNILEAGENREAIEFELRQARGLFLPTIDLEAGVGKRKLDSPGRRRLGTQNDILRPKEASVNLNWTLFDGGERRAELERQASRVDGASHRVLERSESIALAISKSYLEYMLQAEIVAEAKRNLAFHRNIISDISSGITGGILTSADRLQGQERLAASKVRYQEAREEMVDAGIRFRKLSGLHMSNPKYPGSVARHLPKSIKEALVVAQANNSRVAAAGADIDAADADVRKEKSKILPRVVFTGSARNGDDIDGSSGQTTDLEVGVVARWNVFNGGRTLSLHQEKIRRANEQRMRLDGIYREVEESIRSSWNRKSQQRTLARELLYQSKINARLVSSYRQQFRVGQRSLLDVLDAQNTRVNARINARIAHYAAGYADYSILATTGTFLTALNLDTVHQTEAYARAEFSVPEYDFSQYKTIPSRQVANNPFDLLAPIQY